MKPSPLKYALRSIGFIGFVSTHFWIRATLCAAGCAGVAIAVMEEKREEK